MFARPGRAFNRDQICCFIIGMALIVLKGLRIRKVRRALRPPLFTLGIKFTRETHTTKKSSQFHASRRQDLACTTNPIPRILLTHSKMKMPVKTLSTYSSSALILEKYVGPQIRSLQSVIASITELPRIIVVINRSNHFHSMNQTMALRTEQFASSKNRLRRSQITSLPCTKNFPSLFFFFSFYSFLMEVSC